MEAIIGLSSLAFVWILFEVYKDEKERRIKIKLMEEERF